MDRNPITIEALETLDAIERRGSFAKASEELNKATSAVSYTVQKLEDQLDVALFQRQGRRSVLTPAGELLLAEGREILSAAKRLAGKTREVATGWEPRINVALESLQHYEAFFRVLADFLDEHPTIEIDVRESVLNGGWEALELGQVDLVLGSPGPVPQQKGYRAVSIKTPELVPVIAAQHPQASHATRPSAENAQLDSLRRVITHDTSVTDIARTAGLSSDGRKFYVQNIDQKVAAIRAGIGIGHLPRQRVQSHLDCGELLQLQGIEPQTHDNYMAWKIANKGMGLKALTGMLQTALAI